MSDIKLPELPKRFDNICALNECGDIEEVQVYTAEQMQEYAKQAAELERERCAKVCDLHYELRAEGGFPREASTARTLAKAIRGTK